MCVHVHELRTMQTVKKASYMEPFTKPQLGVGACLGQLQVVSILFAN